MLAPEDFDLPSKFIEFRPNQLQLAAKIASCSRYAFLLDAPTGTGKSLIAAAAQRIYGKGVVYLTNTKQLQDQILYDFQYAKTLKGRSNYVCLKHRKLFPQVSAEECTHDEANPCSYISECPYKIAKAEALNAPLAVLNTAYFLSEANYVGGFGKVGFLVVDEFDSVEDQLMGFIELRVTKRQLDRYHIPLPRFKTKAEAWRDWAKETLSSLTPKLAALEAASESDQWGGVDFKILREAKWLEKLVAKLKHFVREVDDTWVAYYGEDAWSFKPTWVSKYANQVIWDHADKVLGMSATILNPRQVCLNTGLVSKTGRTYDYAQMKSPFPKENRPVYYEPCANVINKEMDKALPRLAVAVGEVVKKYPNDRILVHTVSYKVRDYLLYNLKSRRVITHSTSDRAVVLDKFKASKEPLVLLSPSMDRGVDLVDDECRVVVIAKVPYLDLGDPQVSKRVYGSGDGNDWYSHKAVSTIIQMSGRAVRSASDHADCVSSYAKVLTSDLMWRPAGDLRIGDKILCFDEEPAKTGKRNSRYWRIGSIVATGIDGRRCCSMHLSDGTTLISTYNHKWLIRSYNSAVWRATSDLAGVSAGDPQLLRFIRPWMPGQSYAHGWLAGFADEEGTYSRGLGRRNPNVQHLTFTQMPGLVLDQAKLYLSKLGFRYGEITTSSGGTHLYIVGGLEEKLRFLGEVRPARLLHKFQTTEFSSMLRAIEGVPIDSVEDSGVLEVVTLQVDRGTYIAEGFGAHNTYILDEQFRRLYDEHRFMFPSWYREAVVM